MEKKDGPLDGVRLAMLKNQRLVVRPVTKRPCLFLADCWIHRQKVEEAAEVLTCCSEYLHPVLFPGLMVARSAEQLLPTNSVQLETKRNLLPALMTARH